MPIGLRIKKKTALIHVALPLVAIAAIPMLLLMAGSAQADTVTGIVQTAGPVRGDTTVDFDANITVKPVPDFSMVTAGSYHSVGLSTDGELYAWGYRANYRLGSQASAAENRSTPFPVDMTGVMAGKTITQVDAGDRHTLALDSEGKMYSWGYNSYGQLGDGTTLSPYAPVAVDMTGVLAGKTITQVVAGQDYSLALDSDGKAYAWGRNYDGALGDGTETNRSAPVAVDTTGVLAGKSITQLAADRYRTVALDSDGKVYAWGSGRLGDGTTTNRTSPVAVDTTGALAGKTITQVAAGQTHTLALDTDGKVYAWGSNNNGQLGDSTTTQRLTPVAVDTTGVLAGKSITQLDASNSYSLALDGDGKAYAWGFNSNGQLGDSTTTPRLSPVAVDTSGTLAGKTATQLAAGSAHAHALDSEGDVHSWGYNNYKQLGKDSTAPSLVPIMPFDGVNLDVAQPTITFDGVAAKNVLAYALPDGSGGLRADTPEHAAGTVDVVITFPGQAPITLPSAYTYIDYEAASTGSVSGAVDGLDQTSGPHTGGTVVDFSGNVAGETTPIFDEIVVGGDYNLGLTGDGKLYSWGINSRGQLGNGLLGNSVGHTPQPVDLPGGALSGKTITKMSASKYHSLAIDTDGKVYSWGDNGYGQLGNGHQVDRSTPAAVYSAGELAGKTITQVAAGSYHSLALDSDGKMYTWGSNGDGRLGNGETTSSSSESADRSTPVAVDTSGVLAGKTIVQIAAGDYFSLALDSDGNVYGWGDNPYGQLGNGATVDSNVPVEVDMSGALAGKAITKIVAGGYHALALDVDGNVYSWGYNRDGQLGDNSTTHSSTPIAVEVSGVLAGKAITQLAAGEFSSLVLDSNGGVYGWGSNYYGQLGDGTVTYRHAPVAMDMGALAGEAIDTIQAGSEHSIALTASGKVFSWGNNYNNQLGVMNPEASRTPVPLYTDGVMVGGSVSQVSYGYEFGVALANGKVYSWGDNSWTQLGDGTEISKNKPVAVDASGVLAGKTITQIAVGFEHTLAIDSDGKVYGWGGNWSGALGNGTTDWVTSPVATDMTGALAGKTITQVAAAEQLSLALDSDGKVYGWGENYDGHIGNGTTNVESHVPAATDMTGALAGKTVSQIELSVCGTSYALTTDGQLYAWGDNYNGQIGNGTTTDSNVPVAVDTTGVLAGKTFTDIKTSGCFAVALDSEGKLYAWGDNGYGQLGNGSTTDSSLPVEVDMSGVLAGKTVASYSVGEGYVHVITTEGKVYAWGENGDGYVYGDGVIMPDQTTPVEVSLPNIPESKTIAEITTGLWSATTYARMTDGTVYGWGWNDLMGDEKTLFSAVPVLIDSPTVAAPSVTFDGLPATNVRVVTDGTGARSLQATTPAHEPGVVDVVVTFDGQSPITLADAYTYTGGGDETTPPDGETPGDGGEEETPEDTRSDQVDLSLLPKPADNNIAQPLADGSLSVVGDCGQLAIEKTSLLDPSKATAPKGINIYGGLAFEAICSTVGGTATATISLADSEATPLTKDNYTKLRAYKQSGDKLTEITHLVTGTLQADGTVKLSYELSDGGDLDEDNTANGVIVDPVYIGMPVVDEAQAGGMLSNTGNNMWIIVAAAALITTLGAGVSASLLLKRKRQR